MQKPNKKIFFLTIYALFGIILVYLFLFNTGLDIVEETSGETKEIFVINTTERTINNVSVKYRAGDNEFTINNFEQLLPGEKAKIDTAIINSGEATLIVESPFHLTIEKQLILKAQDLITIEPDFPGTYEFGKSFEFTLKICNNSSRAERVIVEETHERGFFSEPNRKNTITINTQECETLNYDLLPVQKGDTTIYFNVNTENTNETIKQPIVVK